MALYTSSHDDYGFIRKFLICCSYELIGVLSGVKQVLGARNFRLMKRRMVDAIVDIGEYNRYTRGFLDLLD